MRERERIVVSGLTALMLLLWLGFLIHRSPRFPGSLEGSLLGIAAALLMLMPLAYLLIKRVPILRRSVTRKVPLRTLLAWHIYAGILAPILALLHTGHRFASPIGIVLTFVVLVVALSGFVGRYLLRLVGAEEQERRVQVDLLRAEYDHLAVEIRASDAALLAPFANPLRGWLARLLFTHTSDLPTASSIPLRALQISEALADVEYAARSQAIVRRWFSIWLRFHILLSAILYLLLVTHIALELTLGLRWI